MENLSELSSDMQVVPENIEAKAENVNSVFKSCLLQNKYMCLQVL